MDTGGVLQRSPSFRPYAQNRSPEGPPLPLSWPVTINPDIFLKKFCLYESRIYSTQSYICVGTNQALQCIAGDPASWSLNATRELVQVIEVPSTQASPRGPGMRRTFSATGPPSDIVRSENLRRIPP